MPRTVRVVTPIALYAITLRAIPHDIDTLTVWTVNVYILRIDTLNRKLLENQWEKV